MSGVSVTWTNPNFQLVSSVGVEHKQNKKSNTVRAADGHVKVDESLKYWKN